MIKTRFSEEKIKTVDPVEMKGRFTASRVFRSWDEDFVDEDTGDVVSVPRNEIILDRGVLLTADNISKIMFHLQADDIDHIEVSDQQREGIFTDNRPQLWCSTVSCGGKNKNVYLYANSVLMALEITKDFSEQNFPGMFGISAIKELKQAILINVEPENEEIEHELKFYKMEVEITNDDFTYTNQFVLKSKDAETAKVSIESYTINQIKEQKEEIRNLTITILTASVINCEAMVDIEFCKEYLESEKI